MANNQEYDFQVDVWSLGIIAFELVTGSSPFNGKDQEIIIDKIKKYKEFADLVFILEEINVSKEFIDFLKNIIKVESDLRIKIEDIVSHEWITNNTS